MTHDIETFETTSGWTTTGTMTVESMDHPEYIAMHKSASLLVTIPTGNQNIPIAKPLDVDMNGKREIVLSVWSQRKASNWYTSTSDFRYLIEFAPGVVFYMPVLSGFEQVSFWVPELETVESIKITPLFNDDDALVLSACVAVQDEYPLDVMAAVKAEIERSVALETGPGIEVGTVSGEAGDETITAPEVPFIERMSVVAISDGTNSERHAIQKTDKVSLGFASTYDGPELLHDYTNAKLYLALPVEFGRYEEDAIFPGVFIWRMAPSPVMRSSDIDQVYDSVSASGEWQGRRVPLNLVYHLSIDCEARHSKVQAVMNRAVRRFLGSNVVWINGRKHGFQFQEEPVEIEPDQSIEQFHKIQYTLDIEVQEEREDRATATGVAATTVSVNPTGTGVLP